MRAVNVVQALYGGDSLYAGHIDMYAAVRNRTSSGLVIIGGTGYAQVCLMLQASNCVSGCTRTPFDGM